MKYLVFLTWSVIFYYLARGLTMPNQRALSSFQCTAVAFVLTLFLKKHLPFLKKLKFPEVASFFKRTGVILTNLVLQSAVCSVCGNKVNSKIIFGYEKDKQLNPRKKKKFCQAHGLKELKSKLENFDGTTIFAEPGIDSISGSFFYEPQDLKIHGCGERETLEKIIMRCKPLIPKGKVAWMPLGVIGACWDPPFLKSNVEPEVIGIDELIDRLDRILYTSEQKYKKSEFWITEPYGQAGIFIWDSQV